MFPSSVIRKLANSEEMLAETHNFVGLTAHVNGPIDIDALSDAFDTLLEAHPVLTARIERGDDGRHQLVADDLLHSGIEVVEVDDPDGDGPAPHFDQSESLVHLRLTIRDGQPHPTLYVHHALADGHHMFGLIEELLSFYTDLVCNGRTGPVTAQPAPESIETVLADRGIQKKQRSGIERFMPALFAYDLPPSRRADTGVKPASPVRVPMVSCRLSESRTHAIVELCRAQKIGLHSMLSAAILMAEWEIRGKLNIPVPFIYTVDLRYFLSPPVSATGCTNPIGLGTYLAEIDQKTTVVDLARDIAGTFRADLDEGVIQQSRLHFSPQYVGNAPGMPDVVLLSDNGLVPPVRTPPGVEVTATHGELYFAVSAGIEIYFTQIYAEQLNIEYHSHGPAPEKTIDAIRTLLCAVADQHATSGVS
ncbi:MAG: phenolphthiocerol/phthiocerol/phthiodiolone dimycocerosyl transferase [Mycobacterium sp.]|nr:phenolphthiocerol/phthiocerol/phthiodiolone dimycocerosyl transferase [Mycobacterium sp.]MDT5342287.1 phenolphthiocerol/phthiocerol/phthiodiolone dimycocerosyl transferase [Mycobacterium sp.]MDT5354689.1 phenolphthiocerol/phthiocerol/phthiodiolone dimycocerosyl transferase [Mycobacterium sp.]